MINNDPKIKALIYEDVVARLAADRGVSIQEARVIISEMSFSSYCKMLNEAITPPSGQTIGPTSQNSQGPAQKAPQNSQQQPQQSGAKNIKAIWPGQGAPMEVGMTVGLKGPAGAPVPGQVSQVDLSAKGVKVKNPTTGKDEWYNNADIQPFMAQAGAPGQQQQGQQQTTTEDEELGRLLELAGLKEDASGGTSCAGAMGAGTPQPLGGMKRRQATDEEVKDEYTRTEPVKSIIGDTKPNQNIGQLSARLAASGKKTASRQNNGLRK